MRTAPKKTIRKRRHEEGFTLVELMVVIVILGLLATIVAINVIPQGERAKTEKAKTDITQIESALELYKLNMSVYPTTSEGLAALASAPAGLADPSRYQKGGFIKKLPNDPWGRPYLYASPGTHGDADIWTLGADGKDVKGTAPGRSDSHRSPALSCPISRRAVRIAGESSTDRRLESSRERSEQTMTATPLFSRYSRSARTKFPFGFIEIPARIPVNSRRMSEKTCSRRKSCHCGNSA